MPKMASLDLDQAKSFLGSYMATELMAIGGRTGRRNVASVNSLIWLTRAARQAPPSLLHRPHTPVTSASSVKDDLRISGETRLWLNLPSSCLNL